MGKTIQAISVIVTHRNDNLTEHVYEAPVAAPAAAPKSDAARPRIALRRPGALPAPLEPTTNKTDVSATITDQQAHKAVKNRATKHAEGNGGVGSVKHETNGHAEGGCTDAHCNGHGHKHDERKVHGPSKGAGVEATHAKPPEAGHGTVKAQAGKDRPVVTEVNGTGAEAGPAQANGDGGTTTNGVTPQKSDGPVKATLSPEGKTTRSLACMHCFAVCGDTLSSLCLSCMAHVCVCVCHTGRNVYGCPHRRTKGTQGPCPECEREQAPVAVEEVRVHTYRHRQAQTHTHTHIHSETHMHRV